MNNIPSMKVPPKRKGNLRLGAGSSRRGSALNESPSEKEGKLYRKGGVRVEVSTLNESPSEKEGKSTRATSRT